MMLIIPGVGSEPGPTYAFDINASLTLLDQHSHAPGSGVQINPSGLNINTDLTFNGFSALSLASSVYTVQTSLSTLQAVYVKGVDLYYNDGNGNTIQLTASGSPAGGAGSITGLPSGTAGVAFGGGVYTFSASTNTPANIQVGSVLIGNNVALSKYLTLAPPNAMAANFTITLPTLPGAQSFMTIDNSGNIGAATPFSQGITATNIANQTITATQIANGTITVTQLATAVAQALVPAGTISAYGGASAPSGYVMCDGTSYLRSAQPTLFAAISTAYGAPDSTHFNVPDLRGQFLRGVTGVSAKDPNAAARTAMATGGNTGNAVGSIQNFDLQAHNHGINVAPAVVGGPVNIAQTAGTFVGSVISTNSFGGLETRPTNAYVNFIIKT